MSDYKALQNYLESIAPGEFRDLSILDSIHPIYIYRYKFLDFDYSAFGISFDSQLAKTKCFAEAIERYALYHCNDFTLKSVNDPSVEIQLASSDFLNSNGVAAHLSIEEAIKEGQSELIERHHILSWWLNQANAIEAELQFELKDEVKVLKKLKNIKIYSISLSQENPTFLAIFIEKEKIYFGMGHHANRSQAVEKAILESLLVYRLKAGKRVLSESQEFVSPRIQLNPTEVDDLYYKDITPEGSPLIVIKNYGPNLRGISKKELKEMESSERSRNLCQLFYL